jgi:hypothetical protein
MISAFITELWGGLMVDSEGRVSVEFLEYGKGQWWTSAKFLRQLIIVIAIRKFMIPWGRVIWYFDHSSNHTAMAEDALNVYRMNVGPGGKQPIMRDTVMLEDYLHLKKGQTQSFVFKEGDRDLITKEPITPALIGKAKGLVRILGERHGPELEKQFKGTDRTNGLKNRLKQDLDFQLQTTLIHDLITKECPEDIVRFYPKYHCEFSPIERFWAAHKLWCRDNCAYNIVGLRKVVPRGLDAICAQSVRRYFGLCRRYEVAYRSKVPIAQVDGVVQRYTSHRKVLDKSGIVQKLLDSGILTEDAFKSLCSCDECAPDKHNLNCEWPRCPVHGVKDIADTARPTCGWVRVHANGESQSQPQEDGAEEGDGHANGESQSQPQEDGAEEGDEQSAVEDAKSDECEADTVTTVACTMLKCRKWRQVDADSLAEEIDSTLPDTYMFTCDKFGRRCVGKCDCCDKKVCICTCNDCHQIGLSCKCPSSDKR